MRKIIYAETEEEWKEVKKIADKFEEDISFRTEVPSKDITISVSVATPPLGVKVMVDGEVWRKIDGITCTRGKICNITNSGLFGVLSDGSDFFLPQFKLKVLGYAEAGK